MSLVLVWCCVHLFVYCFALTGMESSWRTAADVLEDLSRASRGRLPTLDAACLVRGSHPPPQTICYVDEGLESRPGSALVPPEARAPDLRGITQMIRMVQNYDDGDGTESIEPSPSNTVILISKLDCDRSKRVLHPNDGIINNQSNANSPNIQISKTRLNPLVQEFIPKSKSLLLSNQRPVMHLSTKPEESSSGVSDTISTSDSNNSLLSEQQNTNNVNTTDIDKTTTETSNQIDRSEIPPVLNQYETDREELAAMLRNKINGSSEKCNNSKRTKYAAIANLLKLYSSPPPPPASAVTLRTPDFYEKTTNSEMLTDVRVPVASHGSHRAENSSANRARAETSELEQPEDVRESLNKVNDWLNGTSRPSPVAPRAPLYLGPVTYRRKERRPASETSSSPSSGPNPGPRLSDRYVPPAERVQALERRYRAQAEAKAPRQLNVWDKLHEDLKNKDAEISLRAQRE